MSDRGTDGRAALVTGGSGGIGLAIARVLGEEGYRLTLAAHRGKGVEAAAGALREAGIEAQAAVADVSEERDVAALVAEHRATWGRLDILVNSAGAGMAQPIEKIGSKRLDRALAVNLRGVMLTTREALPLLRAAGAEHGEALVVNLGSVAGLKGQPATSVYAATKAAVIDFSRSTQREVGAAGVHCTALAPGFVDTRMTRTVRRHVPAEEMIRPEDVAEAVRFLLRTSPRCAVPEIALVRARPGPDSL